MADESLASPTRDEVARKIGEAIVKHYFGDGGSLERLSAPLGSVSKAQLDSAIFAGLVESKVIDVRDAPFDLARTLRITPARVKSAVFTYNLTADTAPEFDIAHVEIDVADSNEKRVVMIVDDQFARESLLAEFRKHHVYPTRTLEAARLAVSGDDFTTAMKLILGDEETEALQATYEAKKDEWLADIEKEKGSERARRYIPEVFGVMLAAGVGVVLKAFGAA